MTRFFDDKRNRLVYSGVQADRDMWERRWQDFDLAAFLTTERLNATEKTVVALTKRYLPPGTSILEGGCGLGRYVRLLGLGGFRVIGVDFAEETIRRIKTVAPALDVRVADLRTLPFENESFDGYWSFGVVEHFVDGFDAVGREMRRVLKPGGYLFVTVPAVSRLRALKAALGLFRGYPSDGVAEDVFYQYAYTDLEIRGIFSSYGFAVIAHRGIGVFKGVTDEIPGSRFAMKVLCHFLDDAMERLLGRVANHMHLLVLRKVT